MPTKNLFKIVDLDVVELISDTPEAQLYKIVRKNHTPSIIKVMPFALQKSDPSHREFEQEVSKLRALNEEPAAGVIRLLSSGITDEGFPFIETQLIEAPTLRELGERRGSIFSIEDILQIAEQVSRTIAQCHNLDILHGGLSTRSIVKTHAGTYLLKDFGLSMLSKDQRAGLCSISADPFMAPEQSKGHLYAPTDVYRFGIVMLELLTGRNTIPAHFSRNSLMAHVLTLREKMLPAGLSIAAREKEKDVPVWLIDMIDTCLQAQPEDRFYNGVELYDHVLLNSMMSFRKKTPHVFIPAQPVAKEEKKTPLPAPTRKREMEYSPGMPPKHERPSKFMAISAVGVVLTALAAYAVLSFKQPTVSQAVQQNVPTLSGITASILKKDTTEATGNSVNITPRKTKIPVVQPPAAVAVHHTPEKTALKVKTKKKVQERSEGTSLNMHTGLGAYKVLSKAFFYTEPEESTRRNAFIVHWNNAILRPIEEKNNFFYIVFTNHWGQTSKGWLRKKDMQRVDE